MVQNNNDPAAQLDVQSLRITMHALERFIARYKLIYGEELSSEKGCQMIRALLREARIETDDGKGKLLERFDRNKGGDYYMKMPWRFVVFDGMIITCEITPRCIEHLESAKVPAQNRMIKIFGAIEEDPRAESTRLLKSWEDDTSPGVLWSIIHLPVAYEIGAIIRCFRMLGIHFEYQRIAFGGKEERKSIFFEMTIPKTLPAYEIREIPKSQKVIAITTGIHELLPMGREFTYCKGIDKFGMETILSFFLNKDWIEAAKFMRSLSISMRNSSEIRAHLESLGNLNLRSKSIPSTQKAASNAQWQCYGEIILKNGGQRFCSSVHSAPRKKDVEQAVCNELIKRVAAHLGHPCFQKMLRIRHTAPRADLK